MRDKTESIISFVVRCGLAATVATAGCAADYARQADRQVKPLIRERQESTLGYEAAVNLPDTTTSRPGPKAYERVPTSPIPPALPMIRAIKLSLPYEAQGPEPMLDVDVETSRVGVSAVERIVGDSLVLGPVDENTTVSLGLFESIAYAVENSRRYKGEQENLYIAALSVTLERHLFTPRPFAGAGLRYAGNQAPGDYESALAATAQAGVRQQLPYGGDITARVLVDFVNDLNGNLSDGESAVAAISATIPLLRGAGLINLEPLIRSERNLIYAVRNFEQYRRQFAVDIATQYFNLVTQQQSVRNRYVRYQSLVELTERSRAFLSSGRLSKLAVQRAEQELLLSEDDVNTALNSYQNALDRFKLLIGMPVETPLEISAVAVDIEQPPLSDEDAVEMARVYRLDLQTIRDQLEDARRNASNAKNGLLPDLNLTADADIGNPSGTNAANLNRDTLNYAAGLQLDLPIDRLPERNVYRRALIQVERAARDVRQAEDDITSDVRAALRSIRSAQASLELQRRGIEIAQNRLEAANAFLQTGRSLETRDAVEAQQSLLTAQDRFERARSDLQVQVLVFLLRAGLLRVDPSAGVLGIAMQQSDDYGVTPYQGELSLD